MKTLRIVAVLLIAAAAGCTSHRAYRIVHESPAGRVLLERAASPGYQATHPIRLEPAVLSKLLRGVMIRPERGAVDSLLSADRKSHPVFTPEQVAFLAPLLAKALTEAAPETVVVFEVRETQWLPPRAEGAAVAGWPSGPAPAVTSGRLYAYGRSLIFTLTQYRHVPERADTINMPNRRLPDPTGLAGSVVLFMPQAALREGTHIPPELASKDLPTIVVDYAALDRFPAAGPSAAAPPPLDPPSPGRSDDRPSTPAGEKAPVEDVQAIKDLLIKKELEIERLKGEIGALKRQLAERDAQLEKLKGRR